MHTHGKIDPCLPLIQSEHDRLHVVRYFWNQTEFRLVPKQSKNGKYNPIQADSTRNNSRFICVYN